MKKQTVLERTASQVREGVEEEFENFYILTVKEAFQAACEAYGMEQFQVFMIKAYEEIWKQKKMIPESEKEIRHYIREVIFHLEERPPESEEGKKAAGGEEISESLAADIWLSVEKEIGISANGGDLREDEETDVEHRTGEYVKSFVRVAFMFASAGILAFFLYRGIIYLMTGGEGRETFMQVSEVFDEEAGSGEKKTEEVKEAETGEELLNPGFQIDKGRLILVTGDGDYANERIFEGKQILTFVRGELVRIEKNSQADEHGLSVFGGESRYFVKDGDIYKTSPDKKEERVVGNGHIIWADYRCKKLWYVSSYQVPNSEQVKMTAYEADKNGGNHRELLTDTRTLSQDDLQFSDRWVYYRNGGVVFRKSLAGDQKERMAETEGEYFALGDTLFYMDGEQVVSVSEGIQEDPLEDLDVKLENGQILIEAPKENRMDENETGEVQIGDRIYVMDGNVVLAVGQAPQIYNHELFYLEGEAGDQKLYRKNLEEESTVLMMQSGISTDSFCLAGEWLYYSACMENIDGVRYSQIYRVNLDNMAQEKVGRLFQGVVTALYWEKNGSRIYGEYIPKIEDGKIHGKICVIMADGQMGIVEDGFVRGEESDRFQFVAVRGDEIYCFYHTCTYDNESGVVEDLTSKAVLVEW